MGIILLHHTNKNGDIRGSTSIGAALNSALKIQSENGSSKIEISTEKMRDAKTFTKKAEIIFENAVNEFGDEELEKFYITEGEPTRFWEDESNTWENEIIEYMKSNNDEMITKDFLSSVSTDKHASYNKAIYSLREKGIIQKSGKSTTRLAIWELVKE